MEDTAKRSAKDSMGTDGPRQETDYRRVVDSVPGCVLVADAQGQIVYANKVAVATFGRPLEDLLENGWLMSLDPSFLGEAWSHWCHCIQTNESLNVTWRFRQYDGSYRWHHLKAEPTTDNDCKTITWYLLGVDVDEQVKAQEALKASEQEAREILDRVPAMISIRMEEGIAYTNQRLCDYAGAVITDLHDGSIRDDAGKTIAFHGVMLDTTVQKNVELVLQQSEQQMQRMMDTVPSILWSAAPDGNATFINKKARDYIGMTLDQIQDWGWTQVLHPEEREYVVQEFKKALATGSSYGTEHRTRRADGVYRWHLSRAEPLKSADGQIVQWFGIDIDIDDQKVAEEKLCELRTNLSRTSKNSMVAELSASIAHELNQPLTSLLSNAQACLRWLNAAQPNIQEAVASVERIIRNVRAADAIMRNIRSLFKQQPSLKTPFNMVELIREAVGLIKEDANRRSAPIEYDYEEPVFAVLVDRFQIEQVIINLVTNAIEAMEGIDRPPLLRIRIRRANNGQVLTEFIDKGSGLPVTHVDNIFDAFVTSKANGMGIGLAISRSIVEAHDGQLWAENNPDFGAKFSLLLNSTDTSTK